MGQAQNHVPAPGPTPPTYNTPQNAVYMASPGNSGSTPAGAHGGGCPRGATGYHGTAKCDRYMYCQNGSILGAMMPCVPGTMFDVDIGVCTYPTSALRNRCG